MDQILNKQSFKVVILHTTTGNEAPELLCKWFLVSSCELIYYVRFSIHVLDCFPDLLNTSFTHVDFLNVASLFVCS